MYYYYIILCNNRKVRHCALCVCMQVREGGVCIHIHQDTLHMHIIRSIYTCMLMQSCTCMYFNACITCNTCIHLLVVALIDTVAFCSPCFWHSTLTVTMYIVPGFSDVMLRWWSAGSTILLPFILPEVSSGCHCCHKSMYLPLVQQDLLWYQVKLIQVVPPVTFPIMGRRGTSIYVHGIQSGNY